MQKIHRMQNHRKLFVYFLCLAVFFATDLFANRSLSACSKTPTTRQTIWQQTICVEYSGTTRSAFSAEFEVENPGLFKALAIEKPLWVDEVTLNGKKVPLPLEGMYYKTIPAIPVSMLLPSQNRLEAVIDLNKMKKRNRPSKVTKTIEIPIRLVGLTESDLTIQTGPISGHADHNFFTVRCRTNMIAQVTLQADGRKFTSEPNLIHSFIVDNLKPNTEYPYEIFASLRGEKSTASAGPFTTRTLPKGDRISFAALGDSRTHPEKWAKVASAVVKANPDFVVFTGDMVANGKLDYQWDEEYFGPAKEFFATIPYYAVIGNHERDCPLFLKIFPTPGGQKNWTQKVGPALLIGIDGTMDWSQDSQLTNWLENVLSASKAKFIFLATHYPAWSSGPHGKLDEHGKPKEIAVRQSQEVIMPLLKKYNVAAMLAGHDHCYERSEPENGVTMIIAGGAGAPLYGKYKDAERQNPHSKAFASKLHYCLFTIEGNDCNMTVYTPGGEVIDSRVWQGRN